MASGRSALILAVDEYEDAKLHKLRAPARDAEELKRVLGDPRIGDFEIELCANEPEHLVRRKVARFFANRRRDDLLLLHIACHGLKDDFGRLFFAATNTEVDHLGATALSAEFVNQEMTNSLSRRIVLLLDCCYSGAFASGMTSRAGDNVEVRERFEGSGRAVLTASSSMEYAFEGDELSGEGNPSVFTSAIVRALETGEADRDGDGRISIDELYDYVYDQVHEVTPKQTPSKWIFDVRGDLLIAKSSYVAPVHPADLPAELKGAIESPLPTVRLAAVQVLGELVAGRDASLAMAAHEALEGLAAEDDSRRVSQAATRFLRPAAPIKAATGQEPVEGKREGTAEESPISAIEPVIATAPARPTTPPAQPPPAPKERPSTAETKPPTAQAKPPRAEAKPPRGGWLARATRLEVTKRAAIGAVVAVAASVALAVAVVVGGGKDGGDTNSAITDSVAMKPIGATERATARLSRSSDYVGVTMKLLLKTAGGPYRRYRLMLFDDLASARAFDTSKANAKYIGDDVGSLQNDFELPDSFRSYRYFGIVREPWKHSRRLILYQRMDQFGPLTKSGAS